jgi:WASH complex subunit 7
MMRVMGNHLFDLKLHDVFLPNHTIERDKFDVLAVVRNIPAFVSSYKYNILSQRFLEVTGDNKIISCVSIQQLSDSIRTHGLGILSTTVTAFYRYLTTYFLLYLGKYRPFPSSSSWMISKIW